MQIKAFFDRETSTLSYAVYDDVTRDAVLVDPVLDFDPASGRLARRSIDELTGFAKASGLRVHMILETHAHADHLSGAQDLKTAFPGAVLAIGARITEVQRRFRPLYDLPVSFPCDGSQFDRLLADGERVRCGALTFEVLHTPGHTEACACYRFEGAILTGDALFMPDYGTGRCDFPGGSAERLYDSIVQRLYALPEETLTLTGHDYQPGGREMRYEATIGEHKRANVHLSTATTRAEFVRFRTERDKALAAPRLLHPSVQVNIDAGRLPAPAGNGVSYLRIPITRAP